MADVTNFSLGDQQVWIKDQTARDAAGAAQTAAEDAQSTAEGAQSTATAAQTAAGGAQSTADAAKTAAGNALSAASSALTFAQSLTTKRELYGKKIAFIGDSWGAGNGVEAANSYPNRVAADMGMQLYNHCVGGAGFMQPAGGTGPTFNGELDTLISSGVVPDFICILGGFNDINHGFNTTDVYNAVNALLQKASNSFPQATIIFCGMNFSCFDVTLKFKSLYYMMRRSVLFAFRGCIFVDNWQFGLLGNSNYYNADLVHPNSSGHALIAHAIENALLGGNGYTYSYIVSGPTDNFSPWAECTAVGTHMLWTENDMVYYNMPAVTLASAFTGAFIKSSWRLPNPVRPSNWVTGKPYVGNTALDIRVAIGTDGYLYLQNAPSTNTIPAKTVINGFEFAWHLYGSNTL